MAKVTAIELENFQSIKEKVRIGFSSRDILYGESRERDETVTKALQQIKIRWIQARSATLIN